MYWARSAPLNRSKFGLFASGLTNIGAYGTERSSTSRTTANCAVVMWSRFLSVTSLPEVRIRDRAVVLQKVTKRAVQFEFVEPARKTLLAWLGRRGGKLNDFVFPNWNDYMGHMSTRQYAWLVREWAGGSAFKSRITAHTPFDARKCRSSTKRRGIYARCKSC